MPYQKVSDAQMREIFRLKRDEGISYAESARRLNVTSAFQARLRKLGINPCLPPKWRVDEHFFEKIDTEAKAYWLGFLLADGCIGDEKTVYLGVAVQDLDHLKAFKSAIRSTRKLIDRKDGCWGFGISSRKMVSDLAMLGLGPRKTFIVTPPYIAEHLSRHFWRGVIDGDGTMTCPPTQACLALVGSKPTCAAFHDWLASYGLRASKVAWVARIWKVQLNGRDRVKAACELLYGDATVFLERKKQRADYYRQLQFKVPSPQLEARNARRRARRLARKPNIRVRGPIALLV